MTEKRGWCPGLFNPMESGDGWLVRVKPRVGSLPASALRAIADAAERHGNGRIDLTNRGNLQIRGLSLDSAPLFATEMVKAGLASANPPAERQRNVILSPVADTAAMRLAAALETSLEAADDLAALPDKFSFLIDGGSVLPMRDVRADIGIRLQNDRATIVLDGGDAEATCGIADLIPFVLRLARWCAGRGRMRDAIQGRAARVLRDAGLSPVSRMPWGRTEARHAIGRIAENGAFGFGLAFGQTDAPALRRLADIAEQHGSATFRTTPWRALVLHGAADTARLRDLGQAAGFITDPADPRLHVTACSGLAACARASVDTRGDAAALAHALPGIAAHVSGCAKGCAHPEPSAITLVGRDGRYDLVRGGTAAASPAAWALTIGQVAALLRETARETVA